MKSAALLPLVAVAATAFVVPDARALAQLPVQHGGREPLHQDTSVSASSWKDWLPSAEFLKEAGRGFSDAVATGVQEAMQDAHDTVPSVADLSSIFGGDSDFGLDDDDKHAAGFHGEKPCLTIYQLISRSKYTTRLAKLVNEYDDIVQVLNSTSANLTLFAPVNEAFDRLPKGKKPSKKFVVDLLKYHVGLGVYPARRVLVTHTIPTALSEHALGDKPQRLRTSVGLLSGVRINFYCKVIKVDIGASNGVIHGVNSILVPPPPAGRELDLFPAQFSSLILAFERTRFAQFLAKTNLTGSTIFAPDNAAFQQLGPRANAFLFNTARGRRYLKALLQYHVVPSQMIYSDAYYSNSQKKNKGGRNEAEEEGGTTQTNEIEAQDDVGRGHYHLDAKTLLCAKSVAIDVAHYGGLVTIKLNGYIYVKVADGIARDGVVHVPSAVLIPPHRGWQADEHTAQGEISVEELVERLEPHVEVEEKKGGDGENEL